ncbi:MAG: hypothetical protein LBR72_00520 [Oscillospiraceae bacterium]|nr:hypothetical protein [Oscillospiraceae bacterium]
MKSEKLTVNFTPTEVAQMDYLTQRGLYASRSGLVREGVTDLLRGREGEMEGFLRPAAFDGKRFLGGLGIIALDKDELEALESQGQRAVLRVIGVLIVPEEVSGELFGNAISSARVHGVIKASAEVKAVIAKLS